MILYHGSVHDLDWPDYAAIAEHADSAQHPRGLHVLPTAEAAAVYGQVYCLSVADEDVTYDHTACLQYRPRHLLFRLGIKAIINPDGSGVIIDLDAVTHFAPVVGIEPTVTTRIPVMQ